MIDIFIDDDSKVTIKTTNGLTETAALRDSKPEIARSLDIDYLNRLKCRIEEYGATCFIYKQ